MAFPPVDEQLALLTRGVEKIVPEKELAAKLEWSRKTGTPLRIKYGIDPTAADVHLGHTVPLRKMRQFQDLGHQAVIIIGNATAMVGDPSGRDEARSKKFTAAEVEANATDYLNQVGKVVDLSAAEVHRNGDWFGEMGLAEVLQLCGKVTVAQLLTRDDFSKRYKAEKPIFLHECLYPVMQAQDSVEIKADVELGGTEQLYSFMLARDLQKAAGLPEQVAVMSPILIGTDGTRRMGKSLGNYVGISEDAYEMMKKFMGLPDDVMPAYFELLTDLPDDEVKALLTGHPKDAKVRLASDVIDFYHAPGSGTAAAERWQAEIGSGGLPSDIPKKTLSADDIEDGTVRPIDLLMKLEMCGTGSDARRLIQQGGFKLGEDKTPHKDLKAAVPVSDGMLVWAGKKKVCRVTVQ